MEIRRVLSYNDVLLVPRNSELDHLSDANISSIDWCEAPIINAPMDKVVSTELIKCLTNQFKIPVTIHRFYESVEEQIKFYESCDINNTSTLVFLSVGILAKWKEWIDKLINYRNKNSLSFGILVDVANGDTKSAVETVEYIKKRGPLSINIMAGNVATKSGFARLQDAGANFIRVGIGGGSICSTRTTTGFGMPTLTSIFDCAKIKDTAFLVADGGIETAGDICKAMAAGADLVMVGKMLAATSLSNGDKLDIDGNVTTYEDEYAWVRYSGMASKEAIQKLNSKKSFVSIEGVSGVIPYTGTTEEIVKNIIGNLKSSVGYYAGCRTWDEFRKKVKFVEITQQGWEESQTRVRK